MKTWSGSFSVYLERRVLSILFLGFSSGLPLLLVYSTLSAWLTEAGVTKTTIGLVSLVGIAYAFKFLWSPLCDRAHLPFFTRALGRRRGWMLASQLVMMAAILVMGSTDPTTEEGLWWTVFWAVVVAFASATQDIVIDAYRTEILDEERLGAGAANVVLGYRVGMLAAGGGALIIADFAGWFWAYAVMAALVAVGMVTVLVNPEPRVRETAASLAFEEKGRVFLARFSHLPAGPQRWAAWVYGAVVAPLGEFIASRPGATWVGILAFVALYKYGDALLGVMANPFYIEIGFSKTEIGLVSKGWGLGMTLAGAALGGVMVARLGILRALLVAGFAQAASNLVFAVQAWVGHSVPMLVVTIGVENVTGGMATTAFVAYLSSLCNVAYTATQYALLSSFMAAARTFFASGGGWLADRVDWVTFFVLTTFAAVPGIVLLLWLIRRFPPEEKHGRKPGDATID